MNSEALYSCVRHTQDNIAFFVCSILARSEWAEICSLLFNQLKSKGVIIYIQSANDFNVGKKAHL